MTDNLPDGQDVQIELGDVNYKTAGKKNRPDSERSIAVEAYGQPDGENIPVFIKEEVLRGIESHAVSDLNVELGGALLGGFYRDRDKQFVEITDFIIADQVEHTAAQITFTHDTWAAIDAEREARAPNAQIVGWYHTHPNLGVFLSDPDIFIQQNFFKEPWQVALVIDPVNEDRGFFQAKRGKLLRTEGFYITAEKSRRKQLRNYAEQLQTSRQQRHNPQTSASLTNSGSTGATAWLLILTLLFVAVLIVEGVRGRPLLSPKPPGIEQKAAMMIRMGEFEDVERIYAEALIQKPKDEKLSRKFATIREQAEKLPDISQTRQERFIKWFISEADALAARGDYETAEKLYNAAGVRVAPKEEALRFYTDRDSEVLAAYRYLADRKQPIKPNPTNYEDSEEEGVLRMQTDLRRSWDDETVKKIQSGLKHLISERPKERKEMEKTLKLLEKEYLLKSKGAAK